MFSQFVEESVVPDCVKGLGYIQEYGQAVVPHEECIFRRVFQATESVERAVTGTEAALMWGVEGGVLQKVLQATDDKTAVDLRDAVGEGDGAVGGDLEGVFPGFRDRDDEAFAPVVGVAGAKDVIVEVKQPRAMRRGELLEEKVRGIGRQHGPRRGAVLQG